MSAETHDLLCGHWTFFRLGANLDATARCDLAHDHGGLHRFWYGPHEVYSWSRLSERHGRRPASLSAAVPESSEPVDPYAGISSAARELNPQRPCQTGAAGRPPTGSSLPAVAPESSE